MDVIVYRVETKDGYGPYNYDESLYVKQINANPHPYDVHLHPIPSFDGDMTDQYIAHRRVHGYEYGAFLHAFESPESLMNWFFDRGWVNAMAHVMVVRQYNINEQMIVKGQKQLIFLRGHAERVDFTPIAQFYEEHTK